MACGLLLLVLLICYYPATRSQPNNDINKNSSTISYGRFSTTHLPILHLQHYGHFFGGDSRGIPPTCKHNQLIHDILISSEPTKHYTHPSKTTIKILINLSKNSYHIPIQIWELFEVDPPDAHFVFRPNTLLGNKPQFLLFESIQTLQCILTTCTGELLMKRIHKAQGIIISLSRVVLNNRYVQKMRLAEPPPRVQFIASKDVMR
jgi:hypothetical protein